jgi:hypothetical protein
LANGKNERATAPHVTLICDLGGIADRGVLCLDRGCASASRTRRRALGPRARFNKIRAWGSFDKLRCHVKIPPYDPFSIVLMGAGILLAAKLALSF